MNVFKFVQIAQAFAQLSKDRSTKVGAVAIGSAGEVLSMGYNGMPRGCDDEVEARHERPEKYFWAEHAERNLIYNAARVGVALAGSTIIVTPLFPCMDCARAIVQSGIARVLVKSDGRDDHSALWAVHESRARELFAECGVDVVMV